LVRPGGGEFVLRRCGGAELRHAATRSTPMSRTIPVSSFPRSGLVVPGILFGFDMTIHGAWWLALGLFVHRPSPRSGLAAAAR